MRDEALERGKRLDGRALRRDPSDQHRSRRAAAHARLVGVPARRDPGAGHRHARHRRGSAEGRDGRRRDVEALHAPLQLPAVLGRRSAVPARPRPPRDRPRRARRARARADDSRRRRVPLHHPRRLRHPRVQRLLVDGVGLRRLAGDDGCGRADQGAGRRHRDGPDHGRAERQVRHPVRHRRRRGPLRRHGLQGRRHADGITALQMDIKVAGITMEIMRKALEQARAGPHAHPRQDAADAASVAATNVSALRAAHRHHPHSRSTRSATSSGRAAR